MPAGQREARHVIARACDSAGPLTDGLGVCCGDNRTSTGLRKVSSSTGVSTVVLAVHIRKRFPESPWRSQARPPQPASSRRGPALSPAPARDSHAATAALNAGLPPLSGARSRGLQRLPRHQSLIILPAPSKPLAHRLLWPRARAQATTLPIAQHHGARRLRQEPAGAPWLSVANPRAHSV